MKSLSKLLLCLLGFLLPLCLSAQIPQQRAYVANLPAGGRWYAVTNLDLNALDARIASVAGTSAANSPAPSNDFDYVSYNSGWRKLADSPIVSFDSILEANGSATSRTFSVQSGTFADSVAVGSSSLSQAGMNALTITAPYGITGIPDPRGGSSPVPYSVLLGTNALMALSVQDARAAAFAQSQFLSNEVVRVETAAALAADLTYPIATNALTQATKALMFSGAVSNQLATHKANGAADHIDLATRTYVDNLVVSVFVQPETAAGAYMMATNALNTATNATLVANDAKTISTNAILVANDAKAIAIAATNLINVANMPSATWKGTNGVSIGNSSRSTAAGTFSLGYLAYADDAYSFVFNGNLSANAYASHGIGTFNVNPTNGANGFYVGESTLTQVIDARVAPHTRPRLLYGPADDTGFQAHSLGFDIPGLLVFYSVQGSPVSYSLDLIPIAYNTATQGVAMAQQALDRPTGTDTGTVTGVVGSALATNKVYVLNTAGSPGQLTSDFDQLTFDAQVRYDPPRFSKATEVDLVVVEDIYTTAVLAGFATNRGLIIAAGVYPGPTFSLPIYPEDQTDNSLVLDGAPYVTPGQTIGSSWVTKFYFSPTELDTTYLLDTIFVLNGSTLQARISDTTGWSGETTATTNSFYLQLHVENYEDSRHSSYNLSAMPTNLVAGSNILIAGTKQNPTISALDTPGLILVSNQVVSTTGTLGSIAGTQSVHTASIAGLYLTNDNTSQILSGLFQSNSVVKTAVDYLAETQVVHSASIAGLLQSNAEVRVTLDTKLGTNGNGSALSGITASQVGAMSTSERTDYYTKAEADMVGFYKPITDSTSAITSIVYVVPSISIYRLTATNSTTITFDTSALNTTNQLATWELWVLNASTNNSIIWPSTNSVYYIANPSSISANSQTLYTVWRKFGETIQCNPYLVK